MPDMVLHPQTRTGLDNLLHGGSHAVLLTGPAGAGKLRVARHLASQKIAIALDKLDTYAYFLHTEPVNNTISIDQIRALQHFLQLKTTGQQAIRRVVIISGAEGMTIEAQNALLKSLEEPPKDTMLILTSVDAHHLRPTILSRVQQLEILPICEQLAHDYFGKEHGEAAVRKAQSISQGYTGLLSALLTEDTEHPVLGYIATAKTLLAKPLFERLVEIENLNKQKDFLEKFLPSLRLVCRAALTQAMQKNDQKLVARWAHALEAIYKSEASLGAHPNQKLLLTHLMLQL